MQLGSVGCIKAQRVQYINQWVQGSSAGCSLAHLVQRSSVGCNVAQRVQYSSACAEKLSRMKGAATLSRMQCSLVSCALACCKAGPARALSSITLL
jgi:hypothetical protein